MCVFNLRGNKCNNDIEKLRRNATVILGRILKTIEAMELLIL